MRANANYLPHYKRKTMGVDYVRLILWTCHYEDKSGQESALELIEGRGDDLAELRVTDSIGELSISMDSFDVRSLHEATGKILQAKQQSPTGGGER